MPSVAGSHNQRSLMNHLRVAARQYPTLHKLMAAGELAVSTWEGDRGYRIEIGDRDIGLALIAPCITEASQLHDAEWWVRDRHGGEPFGPFEGLQAAVVYFVITDE